MSGSNLRQSLYFKKEILDRSAEFVLLFGVDEYLNLQDQQQEQESEASDGWKCVKYFLRQPNSMNARSQLGWLEQDYEIALGMKLKDISNPIQCSVNYHWDLREQEAIVDVYRTTLQHLQSKVAIKTIFSSTKQLTSPSSIVDWIGDFNTSWEEEGFWIRSLVFSQAGLILILIFEGKRFRFSTSNVTSSKQAFLFGLKSSVLSRMLDSSRRKQCLDLKINMDIISKYGQLSIYQQIRLVYQLNKELGLTVSYESATNRISERLVVKSSPCSYQSSIAHLLKKCSQGNEDFLFHRELLDMLESSEEQRQQLFQKIYEKLKSALMLN